MAGPGCVIHECRRGSAEVIPGLRFFVSPHVMTLHPFFAQQVWFSLTRPLRRAWQEWRFKNKPPLALANLTRRTGTRVQLIIATPGDEIWASGLLLSFKEIGAEMALTCLTRGEGGALGGHARERLGSVRERELRASAEILGLGRIHFLGYIEPLAKSAIAQPPEHLPSKLTNDLVDQMRRFNPDIVISPGQSGEGWSPASVLVHQHVRRALRQMARAHQATPRWFSLNAWNPKHPLLHSLNPDDPARLEIDASRWAAERLAARQCHVSQAEAWAERDGSEAEAFIEQTAWESFALWEKP
jgi:N-acetylglucosamine malate deacetylase 2